MNFKINIKARLLRHSRNSHFLKRKSIFNILKKFKILSLIIVIILPIYPSFGAIWVDKEFVVWNYDESTILSSYEWDTESSLSDTPSQVTWFVKPNTILDDSRDTSWVNKLLYYTIQSWDSLWYIADKFWVSVNSIIWSNDFSQNRVLKPGDTIKIPPVSGIVYNIASGDNLDSIAGKYKIDKLAILEQNQLDASKELKIWQQIILPWAVKPEPPKPIIIKSTVPAKKLLVKKDTKKQTPKVKLQSGYSISYTGKWNKFAWWNCTYFVANHKNVTWRWNAGQWIANARAAWVPTWSDAVAWAIISFRGSGYNPYYGHVWLVVWIEWNDVIVKDMNYRRINEVTVRRINKNDSSIKWYIYAN
ncbi:MAG: Peptidase M23 [uncultured bacterium (gcode 4)]|uniref:Peptidase M23 n=1 Tax=uncultured bacterium (gcode 4) TaxID=1234023 RepID=K2BVN1_9BACT|nr:MAG: Peptidase M23 [uncultured bacterium (gcode 4)]